MDLRYDLVPDNEFDALCLDVKQDNAAPTIREQEKYPAKLHAHKVVQELGVEDGLIYLPGEPTRSYEDSDMGPAFRQRKYFYYITGVDYPDCAVTYEIAADRLTLWIPYVEPRQALYFGSPPDAARCLELYDVDDVRYTTQLSKFLGVHLTPSSPILYILHPNQVPRTADHDLRGQYQLDFLKLQPAMNRARVIKTVHEVARIRRANAISSAAHRVIAESIVGLRNEREIEAIFQSICTTHGAREQAYPIIAGAGVNASTLHYGANNQPLAGKQLVVVDAGCEWLGYASDITRTLPVGGFFTPEAKAIYRIVERMQEKAFAGVRPGVPYFHLHLDAAMVGLEGLLKLGILRGDIRDVHAAGTVGAFFPHGLGHHVGLEVHDVSGDERLLYQADSFKVEGGKREMITPTALISLNREAEATIASAPRKKLQVLQPNMIVTIEPGIYFCRPYIEGYFLNSPLHSKFIDKDVLERYYDVGGVRIEDDLLVTEHGYENLTSAPKGAGLLDIINGGFERI
ncbi:hypothetical protein S40285_00490 [Stachybotrys chlorohalonatus IBT 40285]|uniref:Xaa-Pro aminopeptidase n=1 Tax=Stachybotrys chlorohalonatus (strain IBT 40285) TaxID=1283841 RepID=A0A084QNE1_STAC4|nr:hypothetical protein S40285_00490 [Stachybotrys chlorohalonata IBT 40285]